MKKGFGLLMILCLPMLLTAQEEATVLYNWQDSTLTATGWLNSRYNEVWGVAINGLEIAIIGSTEGTHFINVTDPATAYEIEAAYIPGDAAGANLIHRDFHDYQGYLYTVADEGPSTLQIIDMNNLPTSTTLVSASNEFITQSHNIFIDNEAGRLYSTGGEGVAILSLENPAAPTLMKRFPNSDFTIPYAHDIFVRGDTAYLNCGSQGLWVVDFSDVEEPKLLGNMTLYEQQGYNHAGWLDDTRPYYFLADETHGLDIKTVSVEDAEDMEVLNTFDADAAAQSSIPHNVIVRGNYLYTSYYYDGLQVFDISDIDNPTRVAYYDTYAGADGSGYQGAWGVYPFFPSGNILVSDMQTGLYVFDKVDESIVGNDFPEILAQKVSVWPQPARQNVQIDITLKQSLAEVNFRLVDLNGREIQVFGKRDLLVGKNTVALKLTESITSGIYFLLISGENFSLTEKLVVEK